LTALVTGKKIAKLRQAQSLTQKELAERAGISIGYLSRIEEGAKKPHFKTLSRIAFALGVKISELKISEVIN